MKKKIENKSIEQFLQFNGKRIAILLSNDIWYVAIKPICEALNVDFEAQRERIANHRILSQLPAKRGVVAADGRLREMLCLPEKYVYGWLFSINSESPGLIEYQQKCYDILFDHFHGALTGRIAALTQRSETDLQILDLQEKLDMQLQQSEDFQKIKELKGLKKKIAQSLKEMDTNLMNNQISFSFV